MPINLYRYTVEDLPFAQGGMGDVYRAVDLLSQETVVIKTINTLRLSLDEKTIRTFFKEAEASFRLGLLSDHIVKVTDIGHESGVHYMAQEYVSGGNLINRLGNVTGTEARKIINNILKALKVAHDHKIIHSDISPDNVLFDKRLGIYKLSDFGLLKIIESHLITRGLSLHRGGKPYYMPPAHYFDPDLINEQTDFYAIGVVYYQLLTGQILKPIFPNPPTISLPVVIKADGTSLQPPGVAFIEDCLNQKFLSVSDVISAFSNLSPQGEQRPSRRNKREGESDGTFKVINLGDEFQFTLGRPGDELLFRSQLYATRGDAKNALKAVRIHSSSASRYMMTNDHGKRFTLTTSKRVVLGTSRDFSTDEERSQAIAWMINNARHAKFEDYTATMITPIDPS